MREITILKEEYDILKENDLEYSHLTEELEDLIRDAGYNQFSKTLFFDMKDQEKINQILKRYLRFDYNFKITKEEEDNV